ncbi:sigma-70 family RNA polymerase sigma factor [Caldibacillus lycopersici]|uniref:Sigma-70 family RNA polymerase sigma factor n=1 Tax=Perspicuibacillus lycopersici TaxID=1325689 RepID=A0AAE3IY01_9BACI|nr:sigma-70 family RNA polymerase sigma factor [Perspicuibacillus lycopersici]MCU9614100.1 sigma-70 family RNA polymerase sigma factor [Perspicuibacillus lycopersici]
MNWADEMILEYQEGKRGLKNLKNRLNYEDPKNREDMKQINSMIGDMDFVIEWLETGRQPGMRRGVDKRSTYQIKYLENMDLIPDISEQLNEERKPLYLSDSQKRILLNIFSSFSLRERQCYILYTAQGLSMAEIAEELGLKKRTVQQYIERARKKVKERMS